MHMYPIMLNATAPASYHYQLFVPGFPPFELERNSALINGLPVRHTKKQWPGRNVNATLFLF